MKRALALILAMVMTMALVACGGDKPTSSTPSNPSNPSNPTQSSKPSNPTTSTPGTDKPAEPADPDADKYGGDLIYGTSNAWTSFDPHQQSQSSLGNKYAIMHYTEGMSVKDINGKIYPQVCELEESADGLTIKFTLRERYFSNGEKVTIEDVDASIRRAAALSNESTFKKYWEGSTYKVEGNTIVITSEQYNINLLSGLVSDGTSYKILPKAICDKYAFTGGTQHASGLVTGATAPDLNVVEDAIGTGPYKLSKFVDEEFVLVRNEKYVSIPNEDAVGVAKEAKCYVDSISFQLNKDASSRTAAMLTGEYDISSIQNEMRETALAQGLKFRSAGTTWTHGIFFNLDASNTDSPVYNVNIRKAIRAIIDVDAVMLTICSGNKDLIDYPLVPTPVVKESTAYHNTMLADSGEWNVKDKAKAEAYVKAANYDGTPIVYLTNATTTGAFYKTAMVVIPAMESIGLKVELMAVDAGSHSALRKDPKTGHDIGCWEVQKNTENPVLHSTFVTGTQGWWSHPVKDETISIMKTTPTGSAESVAAYEKYTQLVIDECPYILFGNPTGSEWTQGNVEKNTTGQINYYLWNAYFTENPRTK
ncbi:MAG: hypothetical protein E7445_04710 [Ruminococcaceae bacterium]|nr:hypothetical protein [Oscillospiraceae bacterium]